MNRNQKFGALVLVVGLGLVAFFAQRYFSNRNGNVPTKIIHQKDSSVALQTKADSVALQRDEDTLDEVKITNEYVQIQKRSKISSGYFISPLQIPLSLSGTFGELRNNHFHAGLDIRTGGHSGAKVVAAASGYVSRIKVAENGYGKALYIQHSNGTTTVYGHLKEYSGAIQDYVVSAQYRKESYEIELFPKAGELPVTKGGLIALSGNTGGSGGPHLHFEIRSGNGKTYNPLLYGIEIEDKISPNIKDLVIYQMDADYRAQHGNFPVHSMANKTSIDLPPSQYGIGAAWVDYFTDYMNVLGVNYCEMLVDGKTVWSSAIENFAFEEGRYINHHIDFPIYSKSGKRYVKFFKEDGNKLQFYKGNGMVNLVDGDEKKITLKVWDFANNSDSVTLTLVGKKAASFSNTYPLQVVGSTLISASGGGSLSSEHARIFIPGGALYFSTKLGISEQIDNKALASPMIKILNNGTALHRSATVSIKPYPQYAGMLSKLVMMMYDTGSRSSNFEGGRTNGAYISESFKRLGVYYLALDTVPPVVVAQLVGNQFSFKVSDRTSDVKSYRLEVDGTWVLLEYEPKSALLFGTLPTKIKAGKHSVNLIVVDHAGNKTNLKKDFESK